STGGLPSGTRGAARSRSPSRPSSPRGCSTATSIPSVNGATSPAAWASDRSRRTGCSSPGSKSASTACSAPCGRPATGAPSSTSGMAKLIYVANVSLDGYIEDAHGSFEWTAPLDEVFTFITDLVRPVGTYLYGRRMYEMMAVWETQPALAAQSELMADFANVWRAADKIVYSTTLHVVSTANTRLEHRFDPDSVRDMKTSAASDLTVGGPTLA